MTAAEASGGVPRRSALRELLVGIGTIMTKELRSRMRGRRAVYPSYSRGHRKL